MTRIPIGAPAGYVATKRADNSSKCVADPYAVVFCRWDREERCPMLRCAAPDHGRWSPDRRQRSVTRFRERHHDHDLEFRLSSCRPDLKTDAEFDEAAQQFQNLLHAHFKPEFLEPRRRYHRLPPARERAAGHRSSSCGWKNVRRLLTDRKISLELSRCGERACFFTQGWIPRLGARPARARPYRTRSGPARAENSGSRSAPRRSHRRRCRPESRPDDLKVGRRVDEKTERKPSAETQCHGSHGSSRAECFCIRSAKIRGQYCLSLALASHLSIMVSREAH